jgi:uncharacterized SAM-binding protein YcdF (DUF218 family)
MNRRQTWWRVLIILVATLIVLVILRHPILRALGNYLIDESPVENCQAVFVLGGNSYDRGLEALSIYQKGLADRIVCTGGNIPLVLAAIDTVMYEADVTGNMLLKRGVPENRIDRLTSSTSTLEESDEILSFCLENNLDTIMVVSSKFHLKRVRLVFEDKFDEERIHICFHGAPSSYYAEGDWWNSEGGMIMVNNEYMKLLYYWLK